MAAERGAKLEQVLVSAKQLDKASIADLEEYVDKQINDETYDLEANLALLKLYQFHPSSASVSYIQKLLIKALLQMPATAFILSMYLIPEKFHDKPEIEPVRTLHQLLEECHFKEFWASPELKSIPQLPGFEFAIRDYAYNVLSISHQKCEESLASEVLNQTGAALKLFLKGKKAELADGIVTFPLTEHNQKRAQEVQSSIQVGYVARIF